MKGLSFHKIDEKYSKVKYFELECIMNMETGYVNVTDFCSSASGGEKTITDYLVSDRYKDLIAEYTEEGSSAANRQTIKDQDCMSLDPQRIKACGIKQSNCYHIHRCFLPLDLSH